MSIEFEISEIIPATPEEVFSAWLNSRDHSLMTGSPAKIKAKEGGLFEAWDGYISGVFLELNSPQSIIQKWRTSDFKETDVDSQVEILLEAVDKGTIVIIRHTDLPDFGMVYKKGWVDFYFTPMLEYFKRI